jgi:hypothetical protein
MRTPKNQLFLNFAIPLTILYLLVDDSDVEGHCSHEKSYNGDSGSEPSSSVRKVCYLESPVESELFALFVLV